MNATVIEPEMVERIDESHAEVILDNPKRAVEMVDEVLTLCGFTEVVKAWRRARRDAHSELLDACRAANAYMADLAARGGPKPGEEGIIDWCDVQQKLFNAIAKSGAR